MKVQYIVREDEVLGLMLGFWKIDVINPGVCLPVNDFVRPIFATRCPKVFPIVFLVWYVKKVKVDWYQKGFYFDSTSEKKRAKLLSWALSTQREYAEDSDLDHFFEKEKPSDIRPPLRGIVACLLTEICTDVTRQNLIK